MGLSRPRCPQSLELQRLHQEEDRTDADAYGWIDVAMSPRAAVLDSNPMAQELKAHVHNGQVVLDEPLDLSEGTPVRIVADIDADLEAFPRAWPRGRPRRKNHGRGRIPGGARC
jgi:hypothetical protein